MSYTFVRLSSYFLTMPKLIAPHLQRFIFNGIKDFANSLSCIPINPNCHNQIQAYPISSKKCSLFALLFAFIT